MGENFNIVEVFTQKENYTWKKEICMHQTPDE